MRWAFSAPAEFINQPERRWISDVLIPTIARQNLERVVFVGTAPYTYQYESAFGGTCTDYVTLDAVPAARVWGGNHHIVDSLENAQQHLAVKSTDVFFLIGVYGFGTNTEDELAVVISAAHAILKTGGLLVFSWNTDIAPDPGNHPVFTKLFRRGGAYGMSARQTFVGRNLVIDLYIAI